MRVLICLALLLGSGLPGAAFSHRHKSHAPSSGGGTQGQFDYYLLTLSWSPEFCHSHSTNPQCSKPFGFVVHGLWPEYTGSGGPENCSNAPGLSDPSTMLDIMPDASLVQHEWLTHGTCSGLTASEYFAQLRKAYNSVRIPSAFQAPAQQFTTSPGQVSQQFSQANLKLPPGAVDVTCQSNYFTSVEICLDKNLVPMTCTKPSPCRTQSIKVPPVGH